MSNQTEPDASLDCHVLPGGRVFPGYDVPTTIAAAGDRFLVGCGQVLHPESPTPPFRVRAVDLPTL